MTSRRWTLWTLLSTLLVGGAVVGANLWVDVYGIFRSTKGRSMFIYGSDHRAKYFLTTRYVPENFTGIVMGSSVSDNWRVQDIESFRFYNVSTDGGNITAQKLLAHRALERPGVVAAICVVHPYMTDEHGLKTATMTEAEYWSAFGSLSLFQTYPRMLKVKLGGAPPPFDEFGSEEVSVPPEMNPKLRAVMLPEGEIHIDDVAFEEYGEMVRELHQKGLFVVAVVPPPAEPVLTPKIAETARFVARMRTLFPPDDLFIDFTTPEFAALRATPENFKDGVHLTPQGQAEVVRVINQRINERRR